PMPNKLPEISQSLCGDFNLDRKHPSLAKIRAKVMVDVIRCLDRDCVVDSCNTPTRGNHTVPGARFRKQCTKRDVEVAAELLYLVVGQREFVVLDLRQGRERNARSLAHFGKSPAAFRANTFDNTAKSAS